MIEPTQEQLLYYIETAMAFYERVKGPGYAPSNKQIQALLAICGVRVALDRINTNREIIREEEQEESEEEQEAEDERKYREDYHHGGE